jgi:glutamine synthetase
VNVEANLTAKIAKTTILPAALRYQRDLADNATAVKAAGFTPDTSVLKQVTELIGKLQTGVAGLAVATGHHGADGVLAEAKHFSTSVLPAMLKVREAADELEAIVDDDIWPLPTFQEILFIK